jgi:outer membrane receptor protein involved in Fe transport
MHHNRFLKIVLVIALLVAAMPLLAQETTGHIAGRVTDASGTPLPGVSVEAVSTRGQRLDVVTDSNGEYRFNALPPGVYSVTATLEGLEPASIKSLTVTLGTTQRADLTLRMSAVSETVTVTAEAPIVDTTRSATATSVTREEIESLPHGRDFTDVVAFTPGARNDALAGGISIDGSSGLENRYVIDGIDTTDPQIGDSAVPMRAEFMEEVQVKTAGYAAEFGGSTGGVINAITRSGTNEFHGGVLVDYENNSWNADRPELNYLPSGASAAQLYSYRKDDRTRWDPGVFLGGPILKDRLWFFGTYQPGITNVDRTVTFTNGVTDTYDQKSTVQYATGNLTSLIGSKLSIKAGFSQSPFETEGALPARSGRTTQTAQSVYDTGTEGDRETYSASADFTATQSLLFSARGGYFMTDSHDTGLPFFDVIHNFSTSSFKRPSDYPEIPANLQRPLGFTSNPLYTAAQARDKYERTSFGFDGTYFLNAVGEHAIKAGFQREQIANDVQVGYNADRIIYYWGRDPSPFHQIGQYGTFRLLNISTLGQAETNNDAVFIQDAWNVRPNLTLNLGVRAEHERIPNYGNVGPEFGIEFDYDQKIAPRLGFAWDPFNNAQYKIYGSYGTYYDVMKYELPRGSFGGDKWVDFWFTFDKPDWTLNDVATCRTATNVNTVRPVCPAGTFIGAFDQRHNAADPSDPTVDPDLKPMEMREFQLGADRALGTTMRLGARYVHKELVRAIEDVGVIVPGGQVYYIANPGYGVSTTVSELPFPKAKREYDALELTFERRLSRSWGLNANYTYSRLWGNYTGLASADEQNGFGSANAVRLSPNVSRAFDVVEGSYNAAGDVVYGNLPTDRPHQFKAQLSYEFPWHMSAAVNQQLLSGTPVTEYALLEGGFFTPYGYGNLGDTPWISQTDLAINQEVTFGRQSVTFVLNVLNLFDQDTVTHYYTVRNSEPLGVDAQQLINGINYEQLIGALTPDELDSAYRKPDVFQAGRSVRLGVRLNF